MGGLFRGLLGLVTIVGAFVLYFAHQPLRRLGADATSGDASVWVYTPHVAPGDTITLGITVYGGADIGIEEIVVRDGDRELRVRGGGADWGSTITTRQTASDAEDSIDVEVEVPPDARPGSTLRLAIDVRYAVARTYLPGSFSNDADAHQLVVEVPVRTPAGALFHRGLAAGWALGLLGVICLLVAWGTPRFERWVERTQLLGDGEIAALFLILVTVGNAMFVGHAFFALPLVAATGWTGTWFFVVACAVWAIAPFVAAVIGYKRDKKRAELSDLEVRAVEGRPRLERGAPYRPEPDAAGEALARTRRVEAAPVTLAAVADALRAAGLDVEVKGKRIRVAGDDGKGPTTILQAGDPARVTVETLRVRNRDMRAALDVLHAALPVLGPVELRLPFGAFLVDHRSTREGLRADFDERFRAWIESLKAGLQPLDVASLLGDKPGTLR